MLLRIILESVIYPNALIKNEKTKAQLHPDHTARLRQS